MVFKVIVFTYILVSVSAGVLPAEQMPLKYSLAAPAVALDIRAHGGEYNDQHGEANYEFSYSVHDAHTGDIKAHRETRHGDNVQGQYSLVEPDGHRRIVDYTADAHSGFNAHVRREEYNHVSPIAAVTHDASSNPVVHHAAPVVTKGHSIPIEHTASPIAIAHQIPSVLNIHESPAIHKFVPTTLAQHAVPAGFSHNNQHPLAVAHHSAPLTVDYQDAHLSGNHASEHSI